MFNRTEQFQLIHILPIYKDSLDLSITNRLVYLIRTARILRFFLPKQNTILPSSANLRLEQIRSFIQGMTEDQLGKEKSRPFVPLVLTVFLMLLGRNLLGMIPNTFPFILRIRRYLRRTNLFHWFFRFGFGGLVPRSNQNLMKSENQQIQSWNFFPENFSSRFEATMIWIQLQFQTVRPKATLSSLYSPLVNGGQTIHRLPVGKSVSTSSYATHRKLRETNHSATTAFVNAMEYPHKEKLSYLSFGEVTTSSYLGMKSSTKKNSWNIKSVSDFKAYRVQRSLFFVRLGFFSTAPRRFTPTSHLRFTFRISSSLFVGLIYYSLERHGLHFFSLFFPTGIPFALAPFIVMLERISFFFRPVSLGIRLRANMTAGHILLHTLRGFVGQFLGRKGIIFCILGRRGGRILEGVFLLETGVCFLQAYVFTVLFTIYLKDAEVLH